MPEWFEQWFGDEYLELYPHRDDREADRLVALLQEALPWKTGWRILDVACGGGRHLAALVRHGAAPTGVDLSATLLRRAKLHTGCPLIRADMRRLPVRARSMDLTLNLFTSFGYFATDDEHDAALAEMLATVRPGGWFVIDFLHAGKVRTGLVKRECTRLGPYDATVDRRISPDGRMVEKTIRLSDGRQFAERVRLLDADELERMVSAHGAEVTARFGSYDGEPVGAGSRVILVARVN
ncbi:MAG: class I SAM-dependent methyltransferase [Gemmatimonadota bacterium]|nr:class I SAM-dependent methyltransferase [Gemmatimonadota bacterium]